jgi:large subunit ribosomal protein L21
MRSKIGALVAGVAAAAGAAGAAVLARRKKGEDELDLEVADAPVKTSKAAAPEAPASEPVAEAAAATAGADDLTAIKGLGKVKAARLAEAGVTTFAQVAAWTDEDIAEVGLQVNTSPGQIKREDWVGQAKAKLGA